PPASGSASQLVPNVTLSSASAGAGSPRVPSKAAMMATRIRDSSFQFGGVKMRAKPPLALGETAVPARALTSGALRAPLRGVPYERDSLPSNPKFVKPLFRGRIVQPPSNRSSPHAHLDQGPVGDPRAERRTRRRR